MAIELKTLSAPACPTRPTPRFLTRLTPTPIFPRPQTLWALARLQAAPPPSWMTSVVTRLQLSASMFSPVEVASTMWALARLGVRGEQLPAEVLALFFIATDRRLSSFKPQVCVGLLRTGVNSTCASVCGGYGGWEMTATAAGRCAPMCGTGRGPTLLARRLPTPCRPAPLL